MNGSTHQALCDVLDEKEPAPGTNTNEEGQPEDLAAVLQGSHPTISFPYSLATLSNNFLDLRQAAYFRASSALMRIVSCTVQAYTIAIISIRYSHAKLFVLFMRYSWSSMGFQGCTMGTRALTLGPSTVCALERWQSSLPTRERALFAEEHEARLQAESSCQDHVQRLAVHAEQVSEYAQQKATDLTEICKQVEISLIFMFPICTAASGVFA